MKEQKKKILMKAVKKAGKGESKPGAVSAMSVYGQSNESAGGPGKYKNLLTK